MPNTSLARAALIMICAPPCVYGHIQMIKPYPLHSTFNPKTPDNLKDHSMHSPLAPDGIYPCKGYISPEMDSVTIWKAGENVEVVLAGSATHSGGSCQFSMSYDKGLTWNVILSYMGGCLVDSMTIHVDIPPEAPSGEALFAWSWFNSQG